MAWLYVPRPPASASAPASEGSISGSTRPVEWSLWCTSSGKPRLRPSSWRGWNTRPSHKRLSGTTLPPSTLALWWVSWISSLAERRARTSPLLGSEPAFTASAAASSSTTSGSPSSARPRGSSGRTSPEQLALFPPSSPSSTATGTPEPGPCFERVTWEPPTSEPASSSWPTPTATRYGTNQGGAAGRTGPVRPSLDTLAKTWATPTVHGNHNRKGASEKAGDGLATQAAAWPTPSGRDWKSGKASDATWARNSRPLNEAAERWDPFRQPLPTLQAGSESLPAAPTLPPRWLNPDFVDWLMGWEPGWTCACARGRTGSERLGMASSPSRQPPLGASSSPACVPLLEVTDDAA